MANMFNLYCTTFLVRLLTATLCGMFIGWEREKKMKSAGLRTHMLVALTACLMMLISKYGFLDVLAENEVKLDPSRMASSVVQAIGFLAAGVIYVKRDSIVGNTTAAGLWTTVGIGLAIGAGFYVLGIFMTLFVVIVVQRFLSQRRGRHVVTTSGTIKVNLTLHEVDLMDVKEALDEISVVMRNISMMRKEEGLVLSASFTCPHSVEDAEIVDKILSLGFVDDVDIYLAD